MSTALAGRVEDALAGLGEAERTALDLRERRGEDYASVAAELGTGREGVADLLVSARLGVWAHLHAEPVPKRRTAQCAPARRVLAAQSDGEAIGPTDLERSREHVAGCEPCQAARLALREAELACRAWRSIPPAPPSVSPRGPYMDHEATQPAGVAARRRLTAAAVALVLLIAVVAIAISGGGDGVPAPAAPATGPGSAQGSGRDVVPAPGDRFCPAEQPDCK